MGRFVKRLTVLVVLVGGSSACNPSATFSVVRPASINAQEHGGTMTVGNFRGNSRATRATIQDLRQRIVASEGQVVQYLENGGGLTIHGEVTRYNYDEDVESERDTCTRVVRQGEQTKRVERPCIRRVRQGQADVEMVFNVTATNTGQTIFAQTYQDSSTRTTRATDEQPPAIDGAGMLEELRANLTHRFARVILPWRETVRVRFGRCGDAEAMCEEGVAQVRSANFRQAIAYFQQAIDTLEAAPEQDNESIAEAYWNLGLAKEYSGDYPGAVAAISRASQLNPSNRHFAPELTNIQQMQTDQERLRQQGLSTAESENVQEGGAP